MSTQNTNTADATGARERGESDGLSLPKRVLSTVRERDGNGMAVSLVGGTLIAGAAWTAARNRRRAAGTMVVAGVALLGVALEQRTEDGVSRSADGGRASSAEPGAAGTGSDLVGPSQTDPRGVSDESDVDTDPDEGSITFTTGGDETGEPKPHLDQSDPVDPRYPDEDDPEGEDQVEVSLSETKMTDELGKVAGPDEEQAYPAMEGTDPEPMSERAPQRYGEGAVANEGTGDDDGETPDGNRATDDGPEDEVAEDDEETT